MIGRLDAREDYKGHRQMIDAWRSVLKRAPGARLRIVGAGDLRGELEQRARDRAIAGSVEFLGAASESDKQRLIAQCRVLAMPSRGEGFGLAYLEAMRMGRPCLVSTVDGGREVVAPPTAGLAVDPGNSIEVAEGVARLLTADAEWWRWSASAVGRYTGFFTAEHFHRRLNDALFAA
jgi:phosphatidylinositol alpha-1,6-mannosyltransferase